jgi:hypothetical protein
VNRQQWLEVLKAVGISTDPDVAVRPYSGGYAAEVMLDFAHGEYGAGISPETGEALKRFLRGED